MTSEMANRRERNKETDDRDPEETWESFYQSYGGQFYKDRHWLRREVPELMPLSVRANPLRWCPPLEGTGVPVADVPPSREELRGRIVGLEAGCGCGSATFPLARANDDLFILACDFSPQGIRLLKHRDEYNAQLRADSRRIYAWVSDVSKRDPWLEGIAKDIGGLDFVTLIYVLSAIEPNDMRPVIRRLANLLRPGGLLFVRDYAAGDMKQSRFDQKGAKMKDNVTYQRGEGTFAHYFTIDELRSLCCDDGVPLNPIQLMNVQRDIVNRKADLTMHRIWIQAKFRRGDDDRLLLPAPLSLSGSDPDPPPPPPPRLRRSLWGPLSWPASCCFSVSSS